MNITYEAICKKITDHAELESGPKKKLSPVTADEWMEVVSKIRSKISHLYFFRSPGFNFLSQNPECIVWQPVSGEGGVVDQLNDAEMYILHMMASQKIKECMKHPNYGKNEVQTLAIINSICQHLILGAPCFHLEQVEGGEA